MNGLRETFYEGKVSHHANRLFTFLGKFKSSFLYMSLKMSLAWLDLKFFPPRDCGSHHRARHSIGIR
jgi:hypothetical protein